MEHKINPKNILVADDLADTRDFIKKILERRGHKVFVACDGIKAKKLLEGHQYDIIFLDCSMPGLTGPELIQTAKEKSPAAKIIIFSGFPVVNDRLVDDLGADMFLQKPLTIEMIEKALI